MTLTIEEKRERNRLKNKLWREKNREHYNEYHRNHNKKKKDLEFEEKVREYLFNLYKIELNALK